MSAGPFTHAAAYRARDVDLDGAVAFIRQGNHCACDAVRWGGLVVYQCAGFDGPHECRAYHFVREADGATVELAEECEPSAYCHERGRAQAFTFWHAGASDAGNGEPDASIRLALRRAADNPAMGDRRLRFDPHPEGHCRACL